MRFLLLFALLAAFGCGPDDSDTPEASDPVAAFMKETGLGFKSCGSVSMGSGTCGEASPVGCVLDAFESCEPAHYNSTYYHRGSWFSEDVLIVPSSSGCDIILFWDSSDREDGCRSITRSTCSSMYPDSWGCSLGFSGCRETVTVVESARGCH